MITQYKYDITNTDTGVTFTYTLSAPLSLAIGQKIEYGPYGTTGIIKDIVHEFYPDGIFVVVKV